MIKSIYLKQLRNAEYMLFIRLFINLIEQNDPQKLKVHAQLQVIKELYDEAEILFKLPLDSKLTGELMDLDNNRDKAVGGLLQVLSGYENHFDNTYSNAARALGKNMKLYGPRIYEMNYQAESSSISGIIRDWETDSTLSTAVNVLGLGAWKMHLKDTNEKFIDLYARRLQESGAEIDDNLFNKRIEINKSYDKMGQLLVAHSIIGKTEDYQKIMNEINALVDKYNILLAGRKPEKKDEGETPTV